MRFFRYVVLQFLAMLSAVVAEAQTPVADSLRTVLVLESNPERQVDLMNDIAFSLFDVDDSTALVFAERAIKKALGGEL